MQKFLKFAFIIKIAHSFFSSAVGDSEKIVEKKNILGWRENS